MGFYHENACGQGKKMSRKSPNSATPYLKDGSPLSQTHSVASIFEYMSNVSLLLEIYEKRLRRK